jgi:protein-disulfide isomerase
MEEQRLTKKELREQKRKEKESHKEKSARSANTKKYVFLGLLILVTIGMIWGIKISQRGAATIQDLSPDPAIGPETATVLIKEYGDFQCPACATTAPVMHDILEEYGDKVRFEFNDFPLPQHSNAIDASIAGQCAFDQGKFFELHDVLYERQSEWSSLGKNDAQDTFTAYAQEIGLDMTAFESCTTSDSAADRVNEDLAEGRTAKINSTPTFLVNGERVVTTPFSKNIHAAIDAALSAGE